jgi:transposase
MHGADLPVRSAVTASAEFIALTLPATTVAAPATNGQAIATPAADIRIEWRRGAATIAVSWPVSAAPECARWLLQCMGLK